MCCVGTRPHSSNTLIQHRNSMYRGQRRMAKTALTCHLVQPHVRLEAEAGAKEARRQAKVMLRLGQIICALSLCLAFDPPGFYSSLTHVICFPVLSRALLIYRDDTTLERDASDPQPTTALRLRQSVRLTDDSIVATPTSFLSLHKTPQWRNLSPQKSRRSSAILYSTTRASNTKKASKPQTRSCASTPTMATPRP
jgi:hypothetical protein